MSPWNSQNGDESQRRMPRTGQTSSSFSSSEYRFLSTTNDPWSSLRNRSSSRYHSSRRIESSLCYDSSRRYGDGSSSSKAQASSSTMLGDDRARTHTSSKASRWDAGKVHIAHASASVYSLLRGVQDGTERQDTLIESKNVQNDSETAPSTVLETNSIESHGANSLAGDEADDEKDNSNDIENSVSPLGSSIASPPFACSGDVGSDQSSVTESSSSNEPSMTTAQFISELSKHIVDLFRTTYESQFRKSTQSQDPANDSSSQSKLTCSSQNSRKSNGKRSRRIDGQEDGEDEDENQSGDNGDKRPVKSQKSRKKPKPVRLFACPFAKFDPERYSGNNRNEGRYRKCSSLTLRDISRVKQHLKRVHKVPNFYCARCYMEFDESAECNLHLRREPPCQLGSTPFEERVTEAQWTSIQSLRLENTPESWFGLFRVLFPGAKEPKSPFQSGEPILVHEFARFFRWMGPQLMYNYVRARCDTGDAPTNLNISLGALIPETFEESLQDFDWQHDPLVSLLQKHSGDAKETERSVCGHESFTALDLGDVAADALFHDTAFQPTELEPTFAELFVEFDDNTAFENITLKDWPKESSDNKSSYDPNQDARPEWQFLSTGP